MILWLKSLRPLNILFFIFFVIAGTILAKSYDIIILLIKIIIVTLLWQYNIILNNIYDEGIDKTQKRLTPITAKLIKKSSYMRIAIFIASITIILSLILQNSIFLFLTIIYLFSATIYSAPPLRLRKYIFSTCFIGIGSIIAFLIGYLQPSFLIVNSINIEIILILVVIFFATSVGTVIKDMKDVEGDKNYGAKTIFTEFGLEKGKRISYILLFLSFISPVLLFSEFLDIIFFTFLAIIAVLMFRKFEIQEPVLLIFFLVFIYCLLKLLGLL